MLTVPKIKDLVNKPTQQYNELLNLAKASQTHVASSLVPSTSNNSQPLSMESELQQFLNELKVQKSPLEPSPLMGPLDSGVTTSSLIGASSGLSGSTLL